MRDRVFTAAHIGVRLLLAALLAYWLLHSPESSTPQDDQPNLKPAVRPTNNLDLQLVRLFWRTNGMWRTEDYGALGDILRARNDLDILARLNAQLPPDQLSLPALQQAAHDQLAAQEWDLLDQTLTQILALQPDDPPANFWMGLLQIPTPQAADFLEKTAGMAGEYQNAAAAVLGVIRVENYAPRDVALRLIENGEWNFAERLLTLQLEGDGFDALAYAYRGYVRDQLGEDGLDDIQTAIALDPALAIGFYMQGLHYRQTGDFDLSLQAFTDAHLLDPENPALAAELGAAQQLNDDLPTAESWFKQAVELAPDDQRFAGLLAAFYADSGYGLEENGYAFTQKAATDYPENSAIQTSWGRVLFLSDEYAEAEEIFAQTVPIAPDDPRLHYYYGELLERLGDRAGALEQYFNVTQSENQYTEAAQQGVARLSR